MHITWHGHSCFKMTGKSQNDEITIVMDPYSTDVGARPLRVEADIVTLNNTLSGDIDASSIQGTPFLIDNSGEYEVKKVFVEGVTAFADKKQGVERGVTTLFRINFEDIDIVHLGNLGSELSSASAEKLEACDILMVPVGDKCPLTTKEVLSLISQLEPVIIIPMLYSVSGIKTDSGSADAFLN